MVRELILGKYEILERLGAGAFGLVYRVKDDRGEYALKLGRVLKKRPRHPSEHEANVLRILTPTPGVPNVIDYGYDRQASSEALVLDLLGDDFQTLRKKGGDRFTISLTIFAHPFVWVPIIQHIHSKDFVHRDIKPGNILQGCKGNEQSVFLVDFGLARRYRDTTTRVHMPVIEGKPIIGTVRYASLNTHLGFAQTRRDDMECLAYSLIDCLRDLPWGRITGGTNKQFEDRVREKKRSWTPERLCTGLPESFQTLLAHARGLKFDEEPDYSMILEAFGRDIESGGYVKGLPVEGPEGGGEKDYAPPLAIKWPELPDVPKATANFLSSLRPGDFIKLKVLLVPSLQFSGPRNSVQIDPSYWQSPSLDGQDWKTEYRPAIVASIERDVVVRKGREGIKISVYPLMRRDTLPANAEGRFIPLASDSTADPRSPAIQPAWTCENTYVYNTCVTLVVSIDPHLRPPIPESDIIQWRLQDIAALETLKKELLTVRPKLEHNQPIETTDGTDTKQIKSSKYEILPSIFGAVLPLTASDVSQPSEITWEGRNGWLKEYAQISNRRAQEKDKTEGSMGMDDSDFIFDSIAPAGERRQSCTVNLAAGDFWFSGGCILSAKAR